MEGSDRSMYAKHDGRCQGYAARCGKQCDDCSRGWTSFCMQVFPFLAVKPCPKPRMHGKSEFEHDNETVTKRVSLVSYPALSCHDTRSMFDNLHPLIHRTTDSQYAPRLKPIDERLSENPVVTKSSSFVEGDVLPAGSAPARTPSGRNLDLDRKSVV